MRRGLKCGAPWSHIFTAVLAIRRFPDEEGTEMPKRLPALRVYVRDQKIPR